MDARKELKYPACCRLCSSGSKLSGINPIQTYSEAATNPYLNIKWRSVYDGVARADSVLAVLATAESKGTVSAAEADSFRKQARVLRGYFHLEAYRMWANSDGTGIPYVDETTVVKAVTNDVDVRDAILADLNEGRTLADNMGQIGRFNKTVSDVLYAKALMQMKKDYAGAKTILAAVQPVVRDPMVELLAWVCGDDASRTQRLVNGKPARYDDPVVIVGASELYEARCRAHHEVPR